MTMQRVGALDRSVGSSVEETSMLRFSMERVASVLRFSEFEVRPDSEVIETVE
jgi:hypothetical protein